MNILFLTMGRFDSIEAHSIYADLLRCFRNHGHEIYTITPNEKRTGKGTHILHEKGAHILNIETGNVTGASNLISKGIAQLSIESIYIKGIKKYFSDVKFDMVMYSTPPITFYRAVQYIKKRDGARSYLLLKDIFPQNAVDLGMMSKSGVKGLIYKYFRNKEKKLYAISDTIGCMSQANVDYVLKHNPEISCKKVEICPNAIEVIDQRVEEDRRKEIRKKYNLPLEKKIFLYGGNLGRPQGIPFLIECLKAQNNEDAFFLIVGNGAEYRKLESFVENEKPFNVKLMDYLPKEDYDAMVGACDVGMIFLDHRFTIPNFPSRLLAYMQARLPILAVTDPNTDIGKVIVDGKFGWWCESNDVVRVCKLIDQIVIINNGEYSDNAYHYLCNHFSVERVYNIIMKRSTLSRIGE